MVVVTMKRVLNFKFYYLNYCRLFAAKFKHPTTFTNKFIYVFVLQENILKSLVFFCVFRFSQEENARLNKQIKRTATAKKKKKRFGMY